MGYYKRLSTYRAEVKRYNASRRKATQLTNTPASGLIRLETVSETERFSMAQDADRHRQIRYYQPSWFLLPSTWNLHPQGRRRRSGWLHRFQMELPQKN